MNKIILCLGLALTSCAPVMRLIQPTEVASLKAGGLTLTLDNSRSGEALMGSRGDGVVLVVSGVNIAPLDGRCIAVNSGQRYVCNLGDVPAGGKLSVAFRQIDPVNTAGINDASAAFYRKSTGKRLLAVWLE